MQSKQSQGSSLEAKSVLDQGSASWDSCGEYVAMQGRRNQCVESN